MKWRDLFSFLRKALRTHPCNGTLEYTKLFCDQTGLDFEFISKRLYETGGFCDCEVLMNSTLSIDREKEMSRLLTQEEKRELIAIDNAHRIMDGTISYEKEVIEKLKFRKAKQLKTTPPSNKQIINILEYERNKNVRIKWK